MIQVGFLVVEGDNQATPFVCFLARGRGRAVED
jgi:hypothetical protein